MKQEEALQTFRQERKNFGVKITKRGILNHIENLVDLLESGHLDSSVGMDSLGQFMADAELYFAIPPKATNALNWALKACENGEGLNAWKAYGKHIEGLCLVFTNGSKLHLLKNEVPPKGKEYYHKKAGWLSSKELLADIKKYFPTDDAFKNILNQDAFIEIEGELEVKDKKDGYVTVEFDEHEEILNEKYYLNAISAFKDEYKISYKMVSDRVTAIIFQDKDRLALITTCNK